ncbi:Flp pilus assembly protein CpaB [Vannielia litorea]|uniref:Flp pilus assembly protein CpaB n=1 Tax=Vannielia litorea TaxID=1217970 RepID=UPI001BCBC391|nr:Flp pilus assembly protein CpaB [Vannielia litorea]MBS8225597.1 Flp pilus assembly protein CpaB [Vannielia litorea]
MRLSALLTAVAGLVVAGGSVYLLYGNLPRDLGGSGMNTAGVSTTARTMGVLVASRDIEFGEPLTAQMLTTIDWPTEAVPEGVFHDPALLLPAEGQEPRRARRIISQGDPLRVTTISDFGEKVTIVQTLSPNTRAMAIKVKAETSVGGFVTPGDRVDVVMTQGYKESLRAVTILQNIRVIGVDQEADQRRETVSVAQTVTVEVTAEQGQRLALAQEAGVLSLSLRSLDDKEEDTELKSTRLSDLLNDYVTNEGDSTRTVVRVRRGAADVTESPVN